MGRADNGVPRWVEDALARHQAALNQHHATEETMRTTLAELQAEFRELRAGLQAQMRELRGRIEARAPWLNMAFNILITLILTYIVFKK